jgi:hypothetical protein
LRHKCTTIRKTITGIEFGSGTGFVPINFFSEDNKGLKFIEFVVEGELFTFFAILTCSISSKFVHFIYLFIFTKEPRSKTGYDIVIVSLS